MEILYIIQQRKILYSCLIRKNILLILLWNILLILKMDLLIQNFLILKLIALQIQV